MSALPTSIIRQLGEVAVGHVDIAPDTSKMVNPRGGEAPAENSGGPWGIFLDHVRTPQGRVQEMKYYDYLERNIPDVRKALDAWATMAVTGNLAGGGDATFTLSPRGDESSYPAALIERLRRLEMMFDRIAYSTVREMVKYGTFTPQIQVGMTPDNRRGVVRLRPIPPGTIFRNVKSDGRDDPNAYWIQSLDGTPTTGDGGVSDRQREIPRWVLPNFSLWTNTVNATETLLYGTSVLQPFGAIGLKVQACLDAIVVARLSRAAMRYKYKIDVSDIMKDQHAIRRRIRQWMNDISRRKNLLSDATSTDSYKRAAVPDDDFYMPAAEGLSYDIETIDGDTNLARTTDVELMVRFYFGALGVPPEYLGHERSQGGRSNLSQVDINFARTSRHIQLYAAAGFDHIVRADMILGGWDPRDYPVDVIPPKIGARDDLLQAQIRALQSRVVAAMAAAGMRLDVNPRWVLNTFMNMDAELDGLTDEEINVLFEVMEQPDESGADQKRGDPDTEQFIRRVLSDLPESDAAHAKAVIREAVFARKPARSSRFFADVASDDELIAEINRNGH